MDTKTLVQVQIFGQNYTIRGEAEQEYILGVAAYVDRKMHEITEKLPVTSISSSMSKIAVLAGCAAVYCLAVGDSAVRQLLAGGIQPVRLESRTAIESLLVDLRQAINAGGIAWIDRLLRRDGDGRRFERMAQEGWQE